MANTPMEKLCPMEKWKLYRRETNGPDGLVCVCVLLYFCLWSLVMMMMCATLSQSRLCSVCENRTVDGGWSWQAPCAGVAPRSHRKRRMPTIKPHKEGTTYRYTTISISNETSKSRIYGIANFRYVFSLEKCLCVLVLFWAPFCMLHEILITEYGYYCRMNMMMMCI